MYVIKRITSTTGRCSVRSGAMSHKIYLLMREVEFREREEERKKGMYTVTEINFEVNHNENLLNLDKKKIGLLSQHYVALVGYSCSLIMSSVLYVTHSTFKRTILYSIFI